MGRGSYSRAAYNSAHQSYVPPSGSATRAGEEKVRKTGKLDPLVDPAEYGVIRRSLVRFEELPSGLLELTIGTSMPVETRLDTTGSMGNNVQIALKALPDLYEQCMRVLPGYDIHIATGIFADCQDEFVLCRPQFEMLPDKIVHQLTLMYPEGGGAGNGGEDPQYGLFGGAYLVAAYINCIGLKRYDFTITDEPARDRLSEKQLIRVFGAEVFEKTRINGHKIVHDALPSTKEVFQDLLKQAHAFVLIVGGRQDAAEFWPRTVGHERIVRLPDVRLLPQVQAIIIGLTEGTLSLDQVPDFLSEFRVNAELTKLIQRSVANIPIAAQAVLRKDIRVPQKGDLFRSKPDVFQKVDLWPISQEEAAAVEVAPQPDMATEPTWL